MIKDVLALTFAPLNYVIAANQFEEINDENFSLFSGVKC